MEQLLQYFRQAEQILDAGTFHDAEEHDVFLQNVFLEVEGKEHRLACHHDGSAILEKILGSATPFQLRVFFEKVRTKFVDICCHRYASHVAERWIRSAVLARPGDVDADADADAGDRPGTLDEQLGDLALLATESFVRLAEDPYGTHVLRLLVRIWCGDLDGQRVEVAAGLSHLAALAQAVLKCPPQVFDLPCAVLHEQASALLQALLVALSEHCKEQRTALLDRILPGILAPSMPTDADAERARSLFVQAADHKVGSRFLEAAIGVLDSAELLLFSTRLVRPLIGVLIGGAHANFVLQCVITRCHHARQFEMLVHDIQPLAPGLVRGRKYGILIRLAQWVVDHELAGAEAVMELVLEAFNLKAPPHRKLSFPAIPRLLVRDDGADTIDESRPISAAGCSLLQLLPHFPPAVSKPVIDGFLDAPVAALLALATHPNASRTIEAVLASRTVSEKVKMRTVRKLRDHVDTLALDKYGSHVVDRCWSLATTELRQKIVDRLLAAKTRLEDSQYGRMVLRNCRAAEYARDSQVWFDAENAVERKRALFADILADPSGDLLPAYLSTKPSAPKRRKDAVQQKARRPAPASPPLA